MFTLVRLSIAAVAFATVTACTSLSSPTPTSELYYDASGSEIDVTKIASVDGGEPYYNTKGKIIGFRYTVTTMLTPEQEANPAIVQSKRKETIAAAKAGIASADRNQVNAREYTKSVRNGDVVTEYHSSVTSSTSQSTLKNIIVLVEANGLEIRATALQSSKIMSGLKNLNKEMHKK